MMIGNWFMNVLKLSKVPMRTSISVMDLTTIHLITKSVALSNVLYERTMQDRKWGIQNHDPSTWLEILGEEVGEACKASLEHKHGGKPLIRYRDEMVQVSAVALAAVECYDRHMKGAEEHNGTDIL